MLILPEAQMGNAWEVTKIVVVSDIGEDWIEKFLPFQSVLMGSLQYWNG
jgi:hypothetical protein